MEKLRLKIMKRNNAKTEQYKGKFPSAIARIRYEERMSYIYKILTPKQWQNFATNGRFTGAPIDIEDGYIHLSTAAQMEETARKYFSNYPEIALLRFETDRLPEPETLKWEPSRGGDLFPHIYAPLSLTSLDAYWRVVQKDETFSFPQYK